MMWIGDDGGGNVRLVREWGDGRGRSLSENGGSFDFCKNSSI